MQLNTDILDRMIDELKPHWTRDKLRELDVRFWMSPEYEYEHSHYDGFVVHKSPLLKGEYIYFATELKFFTHFLS